VVLGGLKKIEVGGVGVVLSWNENGEAVGRNESLRTGVGSPVLSVS